MPHRPHQQDPFASAERAPARRPQRDRVLLVDGDVSMRALLADALSAQGLTVDEATDARDALAIVNVAPPDVVVYALGWGSGLHQLDEIERSIADRGARAPAIVLTTPVWMRARRGITLRGPLRVPDVIAAIGRALSARSQ